MTPERWQAVKDLLDEALARAPAARGAFLAEACGADTALRREVESLLEAGDATAGFLGPPAADLVARLATGLSGRYLIERQIGQGGMATVYLAQDIRHARPVALKVLHAGLGELLGTERFQREVRVTARLDHPHILPVLDSGEAAGLLWYTMPYVQGESLRDRLRREVQLPVDEAVRLAGEIADALEYAHGHGIVHRDIKPENILLSGYPSRERGATGGCHARVADFGMARAVDAAGAAGDQRLTASGFALGTPGYMSPEQASGGAVDARTDVYALGCVLYEMLAGEPPYSGATPHAVLAKRMLEPVPHVRTLRETVPEALERTLTRALAKTPADRFPSAGEFARALAASAGADTPPAGGVPTEARTAPVAPSEPAASKPVRSQKPRFGVAILAAVILLGLGIVFARRSAPPGQAAGAGAGPTRVAVLPFENLGDSTDEYFADGITDEVRGKLTDLPALEVIARTSSAQYKKTTKSPQQIGRELGVDYLLTGTVRWERSAGGQGRVRVSPELVQVSTSSTKWQAPFDAPLTDVFGVQAHVAARVAEALGLALGAGERDRLDERPTANLAAYDAFLKGEAAAEAMGELPATRRAIEYYERAVALDSTFALAWAQLSRMYTSMYWRVPATATATAARAAADRGLALNPNLPEAPFALALYYSGVHRDNTRALEASRRALQLRPKDARFLAGVALNEIALGQTEAGVEHLQEAQSLDPRSIDIAIGAMWALVGLGRFSEALRTADRALALAPADQRVISTVVEVHLAQGDLAGARAVLRAVPREVDPTALVANMATWDDLYWVLDDAQQRLLIRLSPASFGDDRGAWGFALAQTHAARGDSALARAYADSTRLALEARLRDVPGDPVTHVYLGLALAYMGRRADAIREGQRGLELVPAGRGVAQRADVQYQLARIYVMAGEKDTALDLLEPLVDSTYFRKGRLDIDPAFTPLRGNPRFERLRAAQ